MYFEIVLDIYYRGLRSLTDFINYQQTSDQPGQDTLTGALFEEVIMLSLSLG